MGVLHGRTVLIRGLAPLLVLALVPSACGGGSEETAPDAPPPDSALAGDPGPATLLPAGRNGGPMPPVEEARGIPPYPNAIVHVRLPRNTPGMRSLESFTTDPWETVVAFYDSALPGWTRVVDDEVVIYDSGGDSAAVTVMPWNGDEVPAGQAEILYAARTAIGTAWRPEPTAEAP